MLTANLSGICTGILLSFMTGPVFFVLIKTSIEKGFHSGAALATGVFLADATWVLITLLGTRFIAFEEKYQTIATVFGGGFLVAIGIYYLFKKAGLKFNESEDKFHIGHASYFLKGFLMIILNPSILIFWLTVNSILKSVFHIDNSFDHYENILFFTSTLLTCYCMDILKAYFANRVRDRIKVSTIQIMNKAAGLVILLFGCRLLFTLIPK